MRLVRRLAALRHSPLEGGGERVDVDMTRPLPKRLNIYQLSHLKRYEFAAERMRREWSVGDFACGTGYGTVLLARAARQVVGADINPVVVEAVRRRYADIGNIRFVALDLRDLALSDELDAIVSFETLEHLPEHDVGVVLRAFARALLPGGTLILSTPYRQERSPGFHETFLIDEARVTVWLRESGFDPTGFWYQNYSTHTVVPELEVKDFLVCLAEKR